MGPGPGKTLWLVVPRPKICDAKGANVQSGQFEIALLAFIPSIVGTDLLSFKSRKQSDSLHKTCLNTEVDTRT